MECSILPLHVIQQRRRQIVSQLDTTLAEIASILDDMGHTLKLFTLYRSSVDLDEETPSALFDIWWSLHSPLPQQSGIFGATGRTLATLQLEHSRR